MLASTALLWTLLISELLGLLLLVLFFYLNSPGRISAQRIVRFRYLEKRDIIVKNNIFSIISNFCLLDLNHDQKEQISFLFEGRDLPFFDKVQYFAIGRIFFSITVWLIGYFLLNFFLNNWSIHGTILLLISILFAGTAWWGIGRYLSILVQGRRNRISEGMPDALDLILICLDSGSALETAIVRVANELSDRDPMVSAELLKTVADINVIGNRELAFRNLGDRVGTPDMYSIVGILCQSLQYGSSISVALKGATENIKQVEILTLEERAGKLPIQLTMPGLIFTLPQVMILLGGPGVLALIDTLGQV